MEDTEPVSTFRAWIMAVRPRTLPASVAPVAVGTAAAYHDGALAVLPALAAFAVSLLLQVGVNLANDYFDYTGGIDAIDRLGPTRVTQSGLIAPERVKAGMACVFGLAALVGLYLIFVGGVPILLVGIASIIAALAYSGGPYPLASHGLGDPFVFIFFGLVAVCGTYYVQALGLAPAALFSAIPPGLLITAILVVNNLRDIHTDRQSGKRTLAVILGVGGSRAEYAALLAASYAAVLLMWLFGLFGPWVLLPLLSCVMAWKTLSIVLNESGRVLNEALAETARLALVFSLLFSLGIVLSA
jgi:1,4-dihydroxy-2-naphthoate octaprenyltransferase